MDDFEYYKAALANWSARNEFLINKYVKKVLSICTDIGMLDGKYLSASDKDYITKLRQKSAIYEEFIADLKAPAFSDMDSRDDGVFVSRPENKRVDATQLDLLDDDYVRESF